MQRVNRTTKIAILCWALLLALPCFAQQDEELIRQQKQKIEQLEAQIEKGEKALSEIKKDKASTNQRMRSISRQISDREALLNKTKNQMESVEEDIELKNIAIDSMERVLTHEKAVLAEMVREAYRNHKQNNYVLYILGSEDIVDGARRIANIRSVAESRKARIKHIDSLSQALTASREALDEQKLSLEKMHESTRKHRDRLKGDVATAQREITSLTQKERSALKQKMEAEERLDVAIAELRKLTKGNTEGASFSASTSGLKLPLDGGRVSKYKGNMAEIVGRKGSRIRSIYDGKVIDIRQNKVTGKWDVFIAHGEYITSYSNLEDVAINQGDVVISNQTIGTVGAGLNIMTAQIEYKMIFGIYSPDASEELRASDCFKRK